jgi:hypothetical protein
MGRDSSIFMEHWCQGTGAKCPRTQGMGERHLSFSSRWELVGRRHLGSWGAVYLSWTRNSHRTVTCSYFDCCKCKPFPSCRGNAARGSRVEEPRQARAVGREREREHSVGEAEVSKQTCCAALGVVRILSSFQNIMSRFCGMERWDTATCGFINRHLNGWADSENNTSAKEFSVLEYNSSERGGRIGHNNSSYLEWNNS